ncbi:MAG: hypothetical protein IJX77_04810 [Ruminococcus sp.]|nr:hypothetical protein [Ruminococcus sp.]
MDEMKNYTEFSFSNPILIDVFGNYMENAMLASFVSHNGTISLKLEVTPPAAPPKNCEDVLSLLFNMLESSEDTAVGQAYSAKKTEIMRETLLRLSQVLDGFSDVNLVLHTTEQSPENPDEKITKHTEFKLHRTKSETTSE